MSIMGNDFMLKIVTSTISVLETDISQISVSALQNETPSLLSKRWAISGAKLVEVVHVCGREQNENRGKTKIESRQR